MRIRLIASLAAGLLGMVLCEGALADAWVPPAASENAPDYPCYTRNFADIQHVDAGFTPILQDVEGQIATWKRRLDDRLDIYGETESDRAVWQNVVAEFEATSKGSSRAVNANTTS